MKNTLIWVGKTSDKYLKEGINIYVKRLKHYCTLEILEIKDINKFSSKEDLKLKEAELINKKINSDDIVVLLDERGASFKSIEYAKFIEGHQIKGSKRLVFIIGGAFGFGEELYDRANYKLSLSKMTFSHQMIRLFFCEQLYRAYTIIKNEKYHNE